MQRGAQQAATDMGVELVVQIPAHWKVNQLKRVVSRQYGAIKTGPQLAFRSLGGTTEGIL